MIAGSERIRSVLNWYPQINDLDEIVRDTLAWEMKLNERAKPFDSSNKRPGHLSKSYKAPAQPYAEAEKTRSYAERHDTFSKPHRFPILRAERICE